MEVIQNFFLDSYIVAIVRSVLLGPRYCLANPIQFKPLRQHGHCLWEQVLKWVMENNDERLISL